MRPLPRLLAFVDDRVAALEDLGVRAAAIAAVGPAVGLVARVPAGSADTLTSLAARLVALAAPPMATVLVSGRADIALATGAHGVVLRDHDLPIHEVRRLPGAGDYFLIRSVHDLASAEIAAGEGADALVVGTIWESETHPGRPGAGLGIIEAAARLGPPIFAIGGVTPDRAREAREAGAWGVAAIRGVWDGGDCYQAALALTEGERREER